MCCVCFAACFDTDIRMAATRGFSCCVIGAIVASLSWGIVIFLYTNINAPNRKSVTSRPLRFLPRHDLNIPQLNNLPAAPKPLSSSRDENRPGRMRNEDKPQKPAVVFGNNICYLCVIWLYF